MQKMFEALRGTKLELPVLVAAFYGLRRGEVVGLKWDAIDFEQGTISVKRTVTSTIIDGKYQEFEQQSAKTKSSLRALPLIGSFREYFLQVKEAQELNKYKDTDTTSKDTLSNLKEQLADCEITAPCGGVVTAVNSKVGDINAEKNVLLTIEDTSSLKMVATVQEADVLKLQEGMEATVTADATGDEQIKGTVTRVVRVKSQGTTGSDGSTTSAGGYSIEIALDNQELLIGMAVKAKVMIQAKGEVLAVPYDLIQYDDNGQAYVLVAEADENGSATAVRRNITVGDEVDYYTEVTGGDLAEGDMLIYDTTFSIAEGQTFTPEQMYSEQDMGLTDGTGTEVSE